MSRPANRRARLVRETASILRIREGSRETNQHTVFGERQSRETGFVLVEDFTDFEIHAAAVRSEKYCTNAMIDDDEFDDFAPREHREGPRRATEGLGVERVAAPRISGGRNSNDNGRP